MTELKPCPFCGSEDITKHKYGVYRCENCGANVNFSKGVTLILGEEKWNRRANNEPTD